MNVLGIAIAGLYVLVAILLFNSILALRALKNLHQEIPDDFCYQGREERQNAIKEASNDVSFAE